ALRVTGVQTCALPISQAVGGDEDGAGLAHHRADARLGLLLELGVADGEDLVDEEDLGADGGGDGEAEPGAHAVGVGPERLVDERGRKRAVYGEGDERP